MNGPTDVLEQQVALLAEKVSGLLPSGGAVRLAEALTHTTDAALLELLRAGGTAVRLLDAVVTHVAGEVARRSARELEAPLAKRLGEKSAPDLVSSCTGLGMSRSVDWSRLGQRLAPRRSLTGGLLPAEYPVVAAAFDGGELSLDQARVILDALVAIKPHADLDELGRVEEYLVGQAVLLSVSGLMKVCRVLPDEFNPDGVEPREEELRAWPVLGCSSGITA